VQPAQPVVHAVPGGQHHHPGGAVPAHRLQQREPVPAGQHHVQQHEVGAKGHQVVLQRVAVRAAGRLEAGVGQPGQHGGADRLRVLDHQHPRPHTAILARWPRRRLKTA
jgi:hypothetical protein